MLHRRRFARRAAATVVALALVGTAAALLPSAATAQDAAGERRGPASQPAGMRGNAAAPVNLEREMSTMGRVFRRLQAQVKDKSQNEASLAAVAQFEQATLASKGAVPPAIAKLAEPERAKQLLEYRNMMVNLLQQALDLEEQLLAGDNTKAAATLVAMDEIQKQGHKEFRPAAGGRGD